MADPGATFTDAEIKAVEKELKAVYNKAYKELLQKQKEFNAKYAAKEAKKLKQLASGQITQEEFDAWKAGQIFQSKQWEDKKNQILNTMYNANSTAADIINGKTKDVFSFNANYTAYSLEHGAGVNFGFELYDEASVVNLIRNDPQLLPEWKIDQPKDYTWNQKKLNRQINLGIIEGESLDKIANRLSKSLVSQNFNKMRTFARTAMTGAQNAGRQIRLEEAKKLGINVKKEWMATLDAHTRMTHRKLDGQKVDTDKSFDINGMSIRFPGDPLAPAALVYNCRCTMVGDLVNYPSTYDRYDNIDGKRIKGMTYSEWEEAKKNGKDISSIQLMQKKSTEKISGNFELIGGKGDAEITDSIYDYYLPTEVRSRLDEISQMGTYNEFKDYFARNGIELDTGLSKLKTERSNDVIPAVQELGQKLVVAVETYKKTFGDDALVSLKRIVLYDDDLDVQAAYFFNMIGENDPRAGEIAFSGWNAGGREVFHELGHAFQDSHKLAGEDCISFSNRIAQSVQIPNSAYKGTSGLDEENAEMMSEAFAFGFTQGIKKDVDFIKNLRKFLL